MFGLSLAVVVAFVLGALGAPKPNNLMRRDQLLARDAKLAEHYSRQPSHIIARREARQLERSERLARAAKQRRSSCTFTTASAAMDGQADCSTIYLDGIEVPAGTTLSLTSLASGTHVIFEGTTTFGYEAWSGPLIEIEGTDITIDCDDCTIDCDGSRWWDGEGSNGGVTKPKFFALHDLTSSHVNDLYVLNTPVQAFSVDDASSLGIIGVTIDNSAGNTDSLAANTDGFDVGDSLSVTIEDAIVYNQDDCVAINSVNGLTFTGGYCSGGHGLSVGSVGGRSDNTVENVVFESSTVIDSANGVRVKTTVDDTGLVYDVTYEDITLSGITKYGIIIEQNYDGGDLKGGTPTTGIPIEYLTLNGVTGTVDSSGYNIVIVCGDGSCTDWTWEDVDVTGGETYSDCENVPNGATCS